ncbi:MAG: hypothetical protein R3E50_15165 [Halioglobus sp.]
MYSWKAIRTVCSVLLLVPIVHLAYLLSRDTLETLNNSPEAWAREINAYAAQDARTPLPENPIVVVGGRRVILWNDLEEELAPRPVLMRGVGDAIVEDITFNYDRLIGFYRPDTVVLLPGDSEFSIRDSKSATDLAGAIRKLAAVDASYGVSRHFYVFAPLKTILRPGDYPTIDQATQLLRDWASRDERVVILDANPLLSDPEGNPRGIYFRGDGVNLNEHGYLRLSVLLQTQLEADAHGRQDQTSSR